MVIVSVSSALRSSPVLVRSVCGRAGSVVLAVTLTSLASMLRAVSKSWLLHASTCARAMATAGDSCVADICISPLLAGGTPVLLIETAARHEDWAGGGRPVPGRAVVCIGPARGGLEGVRQEGGAVAADLLARAQAGDGDALQDTLVSAWQGLPGFEGRASVR